MHYKTAWITWERQPRNVSLANLFSSDYYEFDDIKNTFVRYIIYIKRTISIFTKGYSTVFVQNPSIVLSFVGICLAKLTSTQVVIDAHNAGVRPLEGRFFLLQVFNRWILRQASFVIVTNPHTQLFLKGFSISSFVLPDPLPSMLIDSKVCRSNELKYDIFVVCSWSEDEPIKEYLNAATLLPDLSFAFTGKFNNFFAKNKDLNIPGNVTMLGFVSESDYIWMMKHANVILDITTREDCLVCGAYEAISLDKPILLANSFVNKDLFGDAAFYSEVTVEELVSAIQYAYLKRGLIKENIAKFKIEYAKKELAAKNRLLKLLRTLKKQ